MAEEQARQRSSAADALAERQRHEIATLQASLEELAASEVGAREAQQEVEARLVASATELSVAQRRCEQLEAMAAAERRLVEGLETTVADQARQLESMAALREQLGRQQAEAALLQDRLSSESAAAAAAQQHEAELAEEKRRLEGKLHKAALVGDRHRQRAEDSASELRGLRAELDVTLAEAARLRQAAAEAAQAHETALAALEGVHAGRRRRNEQLEHDNRQQVSAWWRDYSHARTS